MARPSGCPPPPLRRCPPRPPRRCSFPLPLVFASFAPSQLCKARGAGGLAGQKAKGRESRGDEDYSQGGLKR
eukprot:100914-Rhodomonas_salina.1